MSGVVRGSCLFGMIDLRIFACRFGSFFVISSCSVRDRFLICFIILFSLFLYVLCFLMFFCVGISVFILCSLFCRLIYRLILGVHHGRFRVFGVFSCVSIVFRMVVWMFKKCWSVVVRWVVSFCELISAVFISSNMVSFSLSYLPIDSVFFLLSCFLGIVISKMVRVGR